MTNFLKSGDIVDIIAPASPITKSELKKIKIFLTKNGLIPRFFLEEKMLLEKKPANLFSTFSAKDRFEQFALALENKDSKAIWCARGGYGSADILPFLQERKITQSKMFIGFSDITSLIIFLMQKWGWKVIYAPMLTQLAFEKVSQKSKNAIFDLIFGKRKELKYALVSKNISFYDDGNCLQLIGGCLSVIASHFGTKNQIDWRNKILFLEDIDETGEKLDRYFSQVVKIILETKIYPKVILLGSFKQGLLSDLQKDKNVAKNIDLAIKNFCNNLQKISIPVFQEKSNCLGHSKDMLPLIIGEKVKIHQNLLTQQC
jgi:muramoyltetrapeptide carboxypeptidase